MHSALFRHDLSDDRLSAGLDFKPLDPDHLAEDRRSACYWSPSVFKRRRSLGLTELQGRLDGDPALEIPFRAFADCGG
jgi:hypothetical protein